MVRFKARPIERRREDTLDFPPLPEIARRIIEISARPARVIYLRAARHGVHTASSPARARTRNRWIECYGSHVAMAAEVIRHGKGLRCTRIAVAVDPGIPVRPDQIVAQIESAVVASGDAPGGMGEVGTPLVAPALANAVAKLTGKRVRIGARCPHSG